MKFWWLYLFLGFFNVALPFILITWSETHISSGMASVMNSTQPLATAIFAAIFIREERLTPQRIIGLVVGFGNSSIVHHVMHAPQKDLLTCSIKNEANQTGFIP